MTQKFNSKAFAKAIKEKRGKVSLRSINVPGVSFSTISRLENRGKPDIVTYANICQWLGDPLNKYLG